MRSEKAKENARRRAKAWYWANRERSLAASKKRYESRPEEYRERTKRWRKENPERAQENDRKKRANRSAEYLERRRIDEQNRRARMKAGGGRLSKGLSLRLLAEQGGRCVYCRTDITGGYHLDHIVALAVGGRHADDNMQLLCPDCNRRKHTKSADVFVRTIAA